MPSDCTGAWYTMMAYLVRERSLGSGLRLHVDAKTLRKIVHVVIWESPPRVTAVI